MARILVIDDDAELRTLIQQLLVDEHHEVFVAADGRQGLARHRAEPMQLIISDIYMPELEGLEFIRTLRKERDDVPVIAMSGRADGGMALSIARRIGADVTLTKPFHAAEFLRTVNLVLQGPGPDARSGDHGGMPVAP